MPYAQIYFYAPLLKMVGYFYVDYQLFTLIAFNSACPKVTLLSEPEFMGFIKFIE